MSLHPSAKMVRSSTYSALMEIHNLPSSMMGIPAGPRSVPLLRFKHTSKWNSTVGKQHEPFTVSFETQGMPPEYGVKCEDFTFHSAARMAAVVVRGRDPVEFPTPRKKIQLRIVWPGYEDVDFSSSIDVREITTCELAGRVAALYRDFLQVTRQHQCTASGWTLDQELLKTLRLLAIRNVYDNVYQAEVVVG